MLEYGVRHLPVAENGKPIGMVAARVVLDPSRRSSSARCAGARRSTPMVR
jgi:signal-transduction protein with cAMP-binding, CBS, and nucleotidyltransferase domain